MRVKTWVVIGLVAVGCQEDGQRPEPVLPDAVSVEVVTVASERVPVTVTAVGSAESFSRATLGTKLMGRVADVRVKEGDRVSKGDLLVRIEDRDLTAKRQQAASAVAEAKAVFENASGNATRLRNLYQEKAISKQRLDEAEMGLSRAEAGVSAAMGALAEVEANLGYSSIQSPMDGVVVAKFVQAGDMAAPGAPLLSVEQQNPMQMTVEVSEQDLAFVRVNSAVVTEIEAIGEGGIRKTRLSGRVDAIVPSGDVNSRTFQVKVLIDNTDGAIRSGMFTRVYFPKGEREGLLVPEEAIVREGQLEGVYLVRDGIARLRWIRLGRVHGDPSERGSLRVEVISGLVGGEQVVVTPANVSDGTPVKAGQE